ncbi:MAG: response regulator transcription factor [Phaeodactylibacter sp.]|nr:response regulator transcription factor [Phaeodactylibacter sp.]MCB9273854.1 response regulator transcription factor [Lewinellaceae bacterium]
MLNALIIDDEPEARAMLRHMLARYCPEMRIMGEAGGVIDGISAIRNISPDIVFLDIQLADGTGFDLLIDFPQPEFGIIFITAYGRFALKAFQYNALDYLVKPIAPEALSRAIRKVKTNLSQHLYPEQLSRLLKMIKTREVEKIALSTNEGLAFLRLKELARLESSGSYTTFFTLSGKKVMVARTLRKFEELLPADSFFRTHQSHIVNLDFVSRILKEDGGYALMEDGTRVPVSRRRMEGLLTRLGNISIA